MDGAWSPQEDTTVSICHLLTEFQSSGANQTQVFAHLEQCRALPDFDNYLALILARGDRQPIEVRQSAGLLLKNNIKHERWVSSPGACQAYVKGALLHALGHGERILRNTVGSAIAAVVAATGLVAWPELVPALTLCLSSVELSAVEGGLDALYQVCEDAPAQLEVRLSVSVPSASAVLVPELLRLLKSSHHGVRSGAVMILNLLAAAVSSGMPSALANSLDSYVEGLFSLARDPSSSVQKAVCTGLVHVLQLQPELLMPQMHNVIEYMLESTQNHDEGISLEACEFWSTFCDAVAEPDMLRPFLPRLVPILLRNMVYDDFDEEVADADAAEVANSASDRDADIKPFIHRSGHGQGSDGEGGGKEVARWNLRKCSAAALDVVSVVFHEELLPIITPIVQERIQGKDWRARESAILALGAISEGCHRGLMPYLGELVSMLAPQLHDLRPLIRSITCWTLSRYSSWLVEGGKQPNSPGQLQFDLVITGLLARVLDHNKHVQEAACSALATLEEAAGSELIPRMKQILDTLARAVATYGRRNTRIMYDALGTLAEAVGQALAEPMFLHIIMPPLIAKWQSVADTDQELLPLLECFMVIAKALGPAFHEFAEQVFERCHRIAADQLAAKHFGDSLQQATLDPEQNFLICALDTLSGVVEALGPNIEPLVSRSSARDIVLQCCQDMLPDVRQSAFALVGDLARACPAYLSPILTQLVALSLANLEATAISHATISACNNACWSLGELAMQQRGDTLSPFAVTIVEHLVPVLQSPMGTVPRSLTENCAITLGRVAWICPETIAPHLEHFLGCWCAALRLISDGLEKEHAFLGLCAVVRLNPQGAVPAFTALCEAVVSWRNIHNDALTMELSRIMQMYKAKLVEVGQWDAYMARLSQPAQSKLAAMFKL